MRLTSASDPERIQFKKNRLLQFCILVFLLVWIATFVFTSKLGNWLLENTLVFLFLLVLIPTYKKFKFSDLSYVLMTIFLCLHVYGSMNTYAENPFGLWLQDKLGWERNHYDRIVHFSFGLLIAYPLRDYFMNHFHWPNWVCWTLPCEITLSFSAMYELIEWAVAEIFFPDLGMDYLGTQGDIWDSHKDMGLAFSGSLCGILIVFALKKISGK